MPLVLEAPGLEPQNFGLRIKTLADILECLLEILSKVSLVDFLLSSGQKLHFLNFVPKNILSLKKIKIFKSQTHIIDCFCNS
jgi:hypothetical protein